MTTKKLLKDISNTKIPITDKIQLNNLDWARVVLYKRKLQIENEHATIFDIDQLTDEERDLLFENIIST